MTRALAVLALMLASFALGASLTLAFLTVPRPHATLETPPGTVGVSVGADDWCPPPRVRPVEGAGRACPWPCVRGPR